MTYGIAMTGELRFHDAAAAAAAFAAMMKGQEDNPLLQAAKVVGDRLVFAFTGQISVVKASDRVDGAEFGARRALATAVQGAVVMKHEDGHELRLTALGRDFWQKRWEEGQIGFHEGKPNDLLVAHFAALALPPRSRILVPLAGKAVDVRWLAAQGHEVVGIELSITAIGAFFEEDERDHWGHATKLGKHQAFVHGDVTLVCEDVFALDPDALGRFDAIYDRAALVALEPSTRERYVDVCRSLAKPDARTLLVAFTYDAPHVLGPPWSIDEATVRALFAKETTIEVLERRATSVSPRMRQSGVGAIEETAYLIRR